MFAQEGADVAITGNTDAAGIAETASHGEAAGRGALVIRNDVGRNDVGDPTSVAATFDTAARDPGRLDRLPTRRFCGGSDPMIGRRTSDFGEDTLSAAQPACAHHARPCRSPHRMVSLSKAQASL
ncbi:hypothetical protein [Methylorubrum sp. B1-46]|uniref:hypothetical protein n=1 Tax=Methylorubrum sp. B1-46 TaxID=2897334 RepID=UPI00351D5F0A